MIIAVDTRLLVKDNSNNYSRFIYETFSRIVSLNKEHTFIFIADNTSVNSFNFLNNNIINVVKGPPIKGYRQMLGWYNLKIPSIIKKYKADVFISMGEICSLNIKVPQCIILQDASCLNKSLLQKKIIEKCFKKASAIVVPSKFLKQKLVQKFKINNDKATFIHNGFYGNKKIISYTEKEKIKEKYSGGNEYFVYAGTLDDHNIIFNLLKAFSAFKKSQKSNMQLIIASQKNTSNADLDEALRLFRFKEDVKVIDALAVDDLEKIIAESYAFIYPSLSAAFPEVLIQAMKCNVPVIAAEETTEFCEDAALYFNPGDFKEMATKMIRLFKDENLRNELIEKGKQQSKKFSWDETAHQLWKVIAQYDVVQKQHEL